MTIPASPVEFRAHSAVGQLRPMASSLLVQQGQQPRKTLWLKPVTLCLSAQLAFLATHQIRPRQLGLVGHLQVISFQRCHYPPEACFFFLVSLAWPPTSAARNAPHCDVSDVSHSSKAVFPVSRFCVRCRRPAQRWRRASALNAPAAKQCKQKCAT